MSTTTTTQTLQFAHVRYPITLTMPITPDKCYDDASVEPDNNGDASNEWENNDVRNLPLDRRW
ncbi:hypothetical protein [Nostoc sp. FACHB-888]|uniref:hypothetical protein n=1 Tax=Nostoc sp. FACHB-888 TaxID=2692842 RepID=UPI001F55A4F3|nr:hypothetical protein [Nostoc sp. FACHB-888]